MIIFITTSGCGRLRDKELSVYMSFSLCQENGKGAGKMLRGYQELKKLTPVRLNVFECINISSSE